MTLSLALSVLAGSLMDPPQPDRVEVSSYYATIPASGMSVQTWTCGDRVATLQTSWITTFEPGEARRRDGIQISAMIGGLPVEGERFDEWRRTASAYEVMPLFYAACEGPYFVFYAFTLEDQARWSEPR